MTGRRQRRLRLLSLLAVALSACAVAGAVQIAGLLEEPERDTVDARFEVRGTQAPPDDVVVVKIDDVTFDELDEQWPFRRSLHAKAVDRLTEYKARVIAYDVQFTESTEEREDSALIEALARSDRAVLATTEVNERGQSGVLGGGDTLDFARVIDGDATLRPDGGGVFRRVPYNPQGLRGFAVATVERATRGRVDPASFEDDAAWIDYHGPPNTIPNVSFSRLLAGKVDRKLFLDKIVVVGASAPSLQDVHPTSTSGGELMSGAEIQANAISTVLRGFPLNDASPAVQGLLIALMGFAAPALGLRRRPLSATALAIFIAAAYLVASYLLFLGGTIIPVVTPLIALTIGAIGALSVYYSLAALDREYLRVLFSRFVPENVVEEMVREPDGLRLGGVLYDSTVLFSDIRGFTSYSEGKDPDVVLSVLNRYHGEMSEAILDNGGTLISYIGDGIMAVFGVPIEQDDHADRALLAAREMVGERLDRFNEWMRAEGLGDGFKMGIGLNSGPVTAGKIGSERRLDYTAIGDTVNTAARLEGMTKGTPHQIFVSDTTRARLTGLPADLVVYDELEVRGRLAKVKVWGVAGPVPAAESVHA